jgi:hypothetical protein
MRTDVRPLAASNVSRQLTSPVFRGIRAVQSLGGRAWLWLSFSRGLLSGLLWNNRLQLDRNGVGLQLSPWAFWMHGHGHWLVSIHRDR